MNKTLKLAFSAVLGAAFIGAVAQDNFPDAPEYHWAYKALLNMKEAGILVGYPDGLFRGGRPASRYELAAAVNAVYEKLKGMIDGVQNQVDTMNKRIDDLENNKADKSELAALRDALAKLQGDVDMMKKWGPIIEDLRKLVAMLREDLTKMGKNVDKILSDLSDLEKRVTALEKRKPAVDIHGDINFIVYAGHSTDDLWGVTVDRRPTGVRRGPGGGTGSSAVPGGMTEDLTMGHEAAFTFSGTNEEGPQWHATLVVGNLHGYGVGEGTGFGTIHGNMSQNQTGMPFMEGDTSVFFQDFGVKWDTSIGGQGFSAELGRVGYKTNPWFFQRFDNTYYFQNDRWDNGMWYFDGGIAKFNWGSVNLDIWGGRNSARNRTSTSVFLPNAIMPMTAGFQFTGPVFSAFGAPGSFAGAGDMMVDQSLGANLGFKLGDKGDAGLNYIILDSDTFGFAGNNRVNVMGGWLNFQATDNLSLGGGYGQTTYTYNTSSIIDTDNAAWWLWATYNAANWGFNAQYRHVELFYGAPGDWGRFGFWQNPTGMEGFDANVWFQGNRWKLMARGYAMNELDVSLGDLNLTGGEISLTFAIRDNWDLILGGETARYDLGFATPTVTWLRVGMNHRMGGNSLLRFMYEASNFDADFVLDGGEGSGLFPSFGGFGVSDAKGGLLTVQYRQKF